MTHLPTDAKTRKDAPIARGVLDYFPAALAEVANVSRVGNEQHNPGQAMHWAKEKSTDHADCIIRHLADRGTLDTDGLRHAAKVAWRALALLQTEIEAEAEQEKIVQPGRKGYCAQSCGCWIDDNGTTFDCHGSDACHLEAKRRYRLEQKLKIAAAAEVHGGRLEREPTPVSALPELHWDKQAQRWVR